MESTRTVGVIPARFASTRFPGKMLAPLAGVPLVVHTYRNALQSGLFDELIVATDHPDIARAVEGAGGHALMTCTSHPSGTDRVLEASEQLRLSDQDIVVNIQGDEPLVAQTTLSQIIERLQAEKALGMATAATVITDEERLGDPHTVKVVISQQGRALYFSRSPIPYPRRSSQRYLQHVGVYAFRRAFLSVYQTLPTTPLQQAEDLEQLKVLEHGYPIGVAIVAEASHGIDTPQDLKNMERTLCNRQNTSS